MKRVRFSSLKNWLVFASILSLPHLLKAQGSRFLVQNPSGVSRKADAVVISRLILKDLISIPEKKVAALYINDKLIPSQLDDLNGDGQWDELAFQVDMERNSELEVRVKWFSAENTPVCPTKVHAGLWKSEGKSGKFSLVKNELLPEISDGNSQQWPYRFGGPLWESEKVAYRCLLESGSFISALAKSSHTLLMDTLQLDAGPQKWGSEVLAFDSGMGLGGFAFQSGSEFRRVSQAGASFYRQLANGPVRAVFDLIHEDWQLEDRPVNVRQRISIWAGQQGFKSELSFTGLDQPREVVINFPVLQSVASAELVSINKAFSALFWHGSLDEKIHNRFGAGLLFPRSQLAGLLADQQKSSLPGKKGQNSGVRFKLSSGQVLEYFIFTGWEKENEYFGNSVQFRNVIAEHGNYLEYPLKIAR
jgi:hypothetical protein